MAYIRSYCPECGYLMRVEVHFPSACEPFVTTPHTCEECGCICVVSDPHKYNNDDNIQEV